MVISIPNCVGDLLPGVEAVPQQHEGRLPLAGHTVCLVLHVLTPTTETTVTQTGIYETNTGIINLRKHYL